MTAQAADCGQEAHAPSCYEILQLHPGAPLELITNAYWRLVGLAQTQREVDPLYLHRLTAAYQTLTNPALRAKYDELVGVGERSVTPPVQYRRRGLWTKSKRDYSNGEQADYYTMLRVTPSAEAPIVDDAYSVLRPYYVRLIQNGRCGLELLDYLDEAYGTLSDPECRRRYDSARIGDSGDVFPQDGNGAGQSPDNAVDHRTRSRTISASNGPAWPGPAHGSGSSPGKSAAGLDQITETAATALAALGRRFSRMSQQERRRERTVTENMHKPTGAADTEGILLRRISSSVDRPAGEAKRAGGQGAHVVVRLSVADGPCADIFDLRWLPATIGADDACDVMLPGLAGHHATLLRREGRFVLFNLAGPELGDPEYTDALRLLEDGDELTLGPYRLAFSVPAEEPQASSNST